MRRLIVFLAVVVLWIVAAARIEAAETLHMTIRPGLDGAAKVGHWMPVEVQIANTGADVSGVVEVQVDGVLSRGTFNRPPVVYSTPAVLPRQSNKRFVLEIYMPTPIDTVTARLVSEGEIVSETEAPIERIGQGEMLCGVMSGNRSALEFLPAVELPGRQRYVRLAHLDPVDLPAAPQLLAALDCLVMSNISLIGIGDAQRAALEAWTTAGGLLVVAGGPGWQKTVAGLPPDLLPVEVVGTVPLRSAASLESFVGQGIQDPGPWLAAEARPTDGAVVISEKGLPLLVTARRGQGAVVFLALDPALEPLRSWRGSPQLWRHVASYAPAPIQMPTNVIRPYSGWGRIPRAALSDLSALHPPTADFLPPLLGLYALVVGPAAYFAVRRIGRVEWMLWLAPLLTVLATAAAFGAARSGGESDILFNKISLVRAWDATTGGYARTYVAAFSPREGTYDLQAARRTGSVTADALVFPLFYPFPAPSQTPEPDQIRVTVDRAAATRPGGAVIPAYSLPARSLGTFYVDTRVAQHDLGGLSADLKLGSDVLSGSLTNGSQRLTGAALVVGEEVVRLGDLAPGERRTIVMPLGEGSPVGYVDLPTLVKQLYPSPVVATPVTTREATSRDIIESSLNSTFSSATRLDAGPVSLIGWLERSPVVVEALGARSTELERTLLVLSLSVSPEPGEEMEIPGTLIERRNLIAGLGRVTASGLGLGAGDALLYEYILPHRPDRFALDEIALRVSGTGSLGGELADDVAQLSVYDWPAATWSDVPLSSEAPTVLGDPSQVVSALGQVRVRLYYRPTSVAGQSPSLTLDRFDLVARGRGV